MAATGTPTPNIGLRRAQGTDPASVDDINYNSGRLDTVLGAVGNTSVQAQIDALNSKIEKQSAFVTMSVTAFNTPTVTKSGNFAYVNIETNQQIPAGSNVTIGTIPSGYRPNARTIFDVPVDNGGGTIIGHAMITIGTDGSIIANTTNNGFIPIKFTYLI